MKRLVLILLAAAALLLAAPAQAQVKFGLTAGVNISKMSFSKLPSFDSDNRLGWYVGPKVEVKIPLVGLGVEVGAQFSQRELKQQDADDASSSKHFRSIEVPVNLRYQIGTDLAALYLKTGPQFGFYVGDSKWQFTDTDIYKIKKSNLSWNIGAGAKLLKHVEIGVGYNIALSKYAKYTGTSSAGRNANFRTNSWQVEATYLF